MAYAKTTPTAVFKAVRDRLRTALTADAGQCYLSLSGPETPPDHEGGVVYRVDPGGAQVDGAEWEGGGTALTVLDADFDVQVWVRVELDETDHDDERLVNATLGVYPEVHAVMVALNDHDLSDGTNEISRDRGIEPRGISKPYETGGWVVVTMAFSVNFGWSPS